MNPEQLEAIQLFVTQNLVELAQNTLIALLIALVGLWLANRAHNVVTRFVERSGHIDATLRPLAGMLARQTVLVLTGLMVLARFGVQTSSIIAVLGAAGLAIGLALQGTLSNVAAGVMLLVLRPFGVGDAIDVGGKSGTVRLIGLFTVELDTFDGVYLSLPNSSVWNSPITNFSRNNTRRIDLTVGIDYDDDIDLALALALEVVQADERILQDPAPLTAVRGLGESSVDLVVRGWTKKEDYWATLFNLQKVLKQRYDAEGITIPFPQRTLHVPGEVRSVRVAS